MRLGIPFTYAQSVGGHTPPYWAREVGHSMAVQYAIMQRHLTGRTGTADKASGKEG